MAAKQLQPQANTQHRLPERPDDRIQTAFAEVVHGRGSLPHPGEDHPVGAAQQRGIIRPDRLRAQPLQREQDRLDIPRIVLDDRCHGVMSYEL